MKFSKWFVLSALFGFAVGALSQNPQSTLAPVVSVNAKYVQGTALGYAPTSGSGLTLNLAPGTPAYSCSTSPYTGGTLSMTASTTNYVYLDTGASCIPAVKTSAFSSNDIAIAIVVTGSSSITTITDYRAIMPMPGSGAGVSTFNARTGAVTLNSTDVDSVGTLSNPTTGNASTATALAATPSQCGSGEAANGVAANGNAQGCFTPGGGGGGIPGVAGAVMELPLTDGTGTTAHDISGNSNNGTLSSPAPAWTSTGLLFNGSLSALQAQFVTTPLTSWGSVVMNICPAPLPQTSGIATSGIFYAEYPTIFAPGSGNTSTGLLLLSGINGNNKYQGGAFSPTIFSNNGGSFSTVTNFGNSGCFNMGYSLGTNDHIFVNGLEQAYTSQGTNSSNVFSSTDYVIGDNDGLTQNAFSGYINYVVVFNSALTAAQQQQESLYVNAQLAQRPSYPPVAAFQNPTRNQQLIFVGDSITASLYGTGVWTTLVNPSPVQGTYSSVNWGLGSDEAATEASMFPYRGGTQISNQSKSYVFIWLGTNDCADGGYSPVTIWGNLQSIARQASHLGGIPIAVTMISRTGQDSCKGDGSSVGVNDFIRSNWQAGGFSGLLDLAEQPNLGANGANSNGTYFNSDGIHLTGGTSCVNSTGYGLACLGADAFLLYADGFNSNHPESIASNSYSLALNEGYVINTPTGSATMNLPDCSYLTGSVFTIVNASASDTITVSASLSQSLVGSGTIAGQASARFRDTLIGAGTGGCYWIQF